MQGQERILRERFAQAACVACGASHHPDDMLVLARRESKWLVLLTCRQCKRRNIFVASFPPASQSMQSPAALDILDSFDSHDAIAQPLPAPPTAPLSENTLPHDEADRFLSRPISDAPVTARDVESVKHFLDGFNGDFRTLFGPFGR